jgi:DNA modification methylase
MTAETFLDGRITLHCGDSRGVLKTIADCSIDSIVTDPPYALVSIVKRFGKAGSAAVKVPEDGSGAYARASAGFMGKAWDTGETAFATEFWAECLRVLKPGGHVVAFSGTRTYHRMAVAIEDAGFEVRDMLSWLYGSGFPKSHDVAKGLDKRGGASSRKSGDAGTFPVGRQGSGIRANAERCAGA